MKPTLTDGGKFRKYYSPMLDSLQFDQVQTIPDKPTKQQADQNYIKYLESTAELQAVRITALEATLQTALIELNKFNIALQMDIEPKQMREDEYLQMLTVLKNRINVTG